MMRKALYFLVPLALMVGIPCFIIYFGGESTVEKVPRTAEAPVFGETRLAIYIAVCILLAASAWLLYKGKYGLGGLLMLVAALGLFLGLGKVSLTGDNLGTAMVQTTDPAEPSAKPRRVPSDLLNPEDTTTGPISFPLGKTSIFRRFHTEPRMVTIPEGSCVTANGNLLSLVEATQEYITLKPKSPGAPFGTVLKRHSEKSKTCKGR